MRIIAGHFKGRRLHGPKGSEIRPTSDNMREAIFNVLTHGLTAWRGTLAGASIVDVFAGTGSLGLEALSRNAAHATFIDNAPASLAITKKNVTTLGIWPNVTILKFNATRLAPPPLAARAPCTLAFLDAPYNKELTQPALTSLKLNGWLAHDALVVIETAVNEILTLGSDYIFLEERTYGVAKVTFLKFCP